MAKANFLIQKFTAKKSYPIGNWEWLRKEQIVLRTNND